MENSWLDEWIQYHYALGVEHFVLYNDDPDTRISDRILKPYVDRGIVENIHVHGHPDFERFNPEKRQPAMSHAVSTEKIRINHYVIRSWQDFWEVKASRPRFSFAPPCDASYFEYHDKNDVFDDEIARRFGHTIKERQEV